MSYWIVDRTLPGLVGTAVWSLVLLVSHRRMKRHIRAVTDAQTAHIMRLTDLQTARLEAMHAAAVDATASDPGERT